jgi:hypothetical protein
MRGRRPNTRRRVNSLGFGHRRMINVLNERRVSRRRFAAETRFE